MVRQAAYTLTFATLVSCAPPAPQRPVTPEPPAAPVLSDSMRAVLYSLDLAGHVPPWSIDQTYLQVGREVPGFAGVYLTHGGDSLTVLVAGTDASTVRERLPTVRAASVWFDRIDSFRVRQVAFSFETLTRVSALVNRHRECGGTVTDRDEVANVVEISVLDESTDLGEVRACLARLGLPPEVVRVQRGVIDLE